MLKKTLVVLLTLFAVMINLHASIQHDIEHHYHVDHDSHVDHDNENNLNTANCEQCLLEYSIVESNHLQDPVKFALHNENIFHSTPLAKRIPFKKFLFYRARAP